MKTQDDGEQSIFHFREPVIVPKSNYSFMNLYTGGPLDMRILGLVKTRISGKSHSENHKVVIPYVHDFSLVCEIKITFAAICLLINYYMLYNL